MSFSEAEHELELVREQIMIPFGTKLLIKRQRKYAQAKKELRGFESTVNVDCKLQLLSKHKGYH